MGTHSSTPYLITIEQILFPDSCHPLILMRIPPCRSPFDHWKLELLKSAGDASPPVRRMGEYVLELLWKDGCEPTMTALLDYAQAGLCGKFDIEASPSRNYRSSELLRSSPDRSS